MKQDIVSMTENSISTPVGNSTSGSYKRRPNDKMTLRELQNREDFHLKAP